MGITDQYIYKNNQRMRLGYTTGSCAAGASKAQAYAAGFSHTLFIDIGILAVAFIVSIVFARIIRKQRQQRSSDAQTMTPPATTSSPQ